MKIFNQGLFCSALKPHLCMCAYSVAFFLLHFLCRVTLLFFSSFLHSGALLLPISRQLFYYSFSKLLFFLILKERMSWGKKKPAYHRSRASPLHLKALTGNPQRLPQNSSKCVKMTCFRSLVCCFWWEWSNIWSVKSGKHEAGAHARFFFFFSVSEACLLCSEQARVNNLLGQTIVSPLTL